MQITRAVRGGDSGGSKTENGRGPFPRSREERRRAPALPAVIVAPLRRSGGRGPRAGARQPLARPPDDGRRRRGRRGGGPVMTAVRRHGRDTDPDDDDDGDDDEQHDRRVGGSPGRGRHVVPAAPGRLGAAVTGRRPETARRAPRPRLEVVEFFAEHVVVPAWHAADVRRV